MLFNILILLCKVIVIKIMKIVKYYNIWLLSKIILLS